MRIALALAPTFPKAYPLIGLASLAAALKREGHEVAVFDFSASRQFPYSNSEAVWHDPEFAARYDRENPGFFPGMAREISDWKPELAGFSCWLSNWPAALKIAALLKAGNPSLFTVFGGPEAGFSPERLLAGEQTDAVISGEGEGALTALARAVADGKANFQAPPGVRLRRGKQILDGGPAKEIEDLDTLPMPDFGSFRRRDYLIPDMLPISFSRGCLRRCAFCNTATSWQKFRHRGARSLFEEFKRDAQEYGARYLQVTSPSLNARPDVLDELCGLLLAGGLRLGWGGPAFFSDSLTPAFLKKLASAGLGTMDFGLESGAPKVLRLMGKGFSAETAERNIRDCFDAGIKSYLNILIGFPGETDEDVELTKSFLKRNKKWIAHVGEPSECIIAQDNLLMRHPERFGVNPDVKNKWATWETSDGRNTHEVRQRRINEFRRWAAEEGLAVNGPVFRPEEKAKNI